MGLQEGGPADDGTAGWVSFRFLIQESMCERVVLFFIIVGACNFGAWAPQGLRYYVCAANGPCPFLQ